MIKNLRNKLKTALFAAALLLERPVKTEETTVLAGATVEMSTYSGSSNTNANAFISQAFLAFLITSDQSDDPNSSYKVTFSEAINAKTVFFVAPPKAKDRLKTTYMCLSSSSSWPPKQSTCKSIYDTGIHSIDLPAADRLSFHTAGGGNRLYSLNQVRVYQAPNLIDQATVITAYASSANHLGPNNLITNLESRSHLMDTQPRINAAEETGNFFSCFTVMSSEIVDGVYLLGFDHGRAIFQHFVTMVQDAIKWQLTVVTTDLLAQHYVALWEVYIGDSPTYSDNPKCAGGPFLKSTYDDYFSNSSKLNKNVPAYGFEAECNLEGRYTFLRATHVPSISVSICSVLVIGTVYARANPLLSTIEMTPMQLKYTVPNIVPEDSLGNVLDIDLRQKQGSELDFISFTELSDSTEVVFNGRGLVPGATYSLILESFDANSSVQSVLKTDTITISVAEAFRDTPLPSELKVQVGKIQTLDVAFVRTDDSVPAQASVTVTQDLTINLRQKSGEELSFVAIVEQGDHSDVAIDATQLTSGQSHTLVLESFDTNGGPSYPTLYTDTITISVVEAERTNAAPTDIQVTAGKGLYYKVDNCIVNSEVTNQSLVTVDALSVNIRQKAGSELSWVTTAEYTGYTDVIVDPRNIDAGGTYTLYLESFDASTASNAPFKTDIVTISVVSAKRITEVTSELKVQAGFALTLDVAHAQARVGVTRQASSTFTVNPLSVNLRQKSGAELSFVSLVEQSDHTDVLVDSSQLVVGETHTLVLESVSTDNLQGSAAKTDTITISVVEAVHSSPIPTDVKIAASGNVNFNVYHATIRSEVSGQSSVTMNPLAVNIREKEGTRLGDGVYFVEQSTKTLVILDAQGRSSGFTATIFLESFDTNTSSGRALRTDTLTFSVLEAVRAEEILTNVKIQAPGQLTMKVPHCVESDEVTSQTGLMDTGLNFKIVLLRQVNLRQKSGQELSFVSFVEQSDHSEVIIDASLLTPGESYSLILESVKQVKVDGSTAKTDTITITTLEAIRDQQLATSLKVFSEQQTTLEVPHARISDQVSAQASASVMIGSFSPNLRQKSGQELSFVSLVEQSDHTQVLIDGTSLTQGDSYSLVLETIESTNAAASVALTDTITLNVESVVRQSPLPSQLYIQAAGQASFEVPHVTESTSNPIQGINLRQKKGEELSFVSFVEESDHTVVLLDATNLAPRESNRRQLNESSDGTYSVTLESYDSNSGADGPTIFTDSLTLSSVEAVRELPLPESIQINVGGQVVLEVPQAFISDEVLSQAFLTLRSTQTFNDLRQKAGTELSFVSFTPRTEFTEVIVDGTDLIIGSQYSLVLEAFDSDVLSGSAARIDTIEIIVDGVLSLATFKEPLERFVVAIGQASTMTLPTIDSGVSGEVEIIVEMESEIKDYFTFNASKMSITYSGKMAEEIKVVDAFATVQISIQLKNSVGVNKYLLDITLTSFSTENLTLDRVDVDDDDASEEDIEETTEKIDITVDLDCFDGELKGADGVCRAVVDEVQKCNTELDCENLQAEKELVEAEQLALLQAIGLVYDPETPFEIFTAKVTESLTNENLLSNPEQFEVVIGALLGVTDVKKALVESSTVYKIDEDTDLKQAATFDIDKFIKSLGVNSRQKTRRETPSFIFEQELEEDFILPNKFQINPTGEAVFDFGASFQPQEVGKIVAALLPQASDRRLLEDSIQSNGDGSISYETEVEMTAQLMPISQILKISKMVKCTLVPGSDNYIDMKGFTWELYSYQSNKLGIKFDFEHPEYISYGEIDSMLIEFNQAKLFMPPSSNDGNLLSTPSGYTSVLKIPPQGIGLLSEEEVEAAKDQGSSFVIGNLVLSLLLKQTMAMLLGSIVVIQILAHLPLADIYLPANAHQQFDLMISFVSFDYFQPSNYVDFGFTKVPSWSERFEWLGYDNINFVEGMGSIIIFAGFSLVQILLSLIFVCMRRLTKRDFLKSKLQVGQSIGAALGFIHGTFFEVLVCVSISMRMLTFTDYLNGADVTSVVLSFVFGAILLLYIAYLLYFSLTKSNLWVTRSKATLALSRQESLKSIHNDLLKSQEKVKPQSSSQVDEILKKRQDETQALIKRAETIDEDQFAKFAPLVEDLRTDSHVSMFYNVFITCRRLVLLYLAMFIVGQQWLQVLTFMTMNLVSVSFLTAALPFESKFLNYLSIFNEGLALVISYFIAQINNMAYDPAVSTIIGSIIVYLIYGSWVINGLMIMVVSAKEAYGKLRRYYLTKIRWKYACLRPKMKSDESPKKQPPRKDTIPSKSEQNQKCLKLSSICEEDSLSVSDEDDSSPQPSKRKSKKAKRALKKEKKVRKNVYKASEVQSQEIDPQLAFNLNEKILLDPKKRTYKTEAQVSSPRKGAQLIREERRNNQILESLALIDTNLSKQQVDLNLGASAAERIGPQTLQDRRNSDVPSIEVDICSERNHPRRLQMESSNNAMVVHDLD